MAPGQRLQRIVLAAQERIVVRLQLVPRIEGFGLHSKRSGSAPCPAQGPCTLVEPAASAELAFVAPTELAFVATTGLAFVAPAELAFVAPTVLAFAAPAVLAFAAPADSS